MREREWKTVFSRSHWNAIVRDALREGGAHWINVYLPRRFTDYAETALGYSAKKMQGKKKSIIAAAFANGEIQRIADRFFMGWDPWTGGRIPGPVWQKYLMDQQARGRFQFSRTGDWKRAKRDFRAYAKASFRSELQARQDDDKFVLTPLVHTGALRELALSAARAESKATTNDQRLRIVIPQPHPTHPMVSAVMRRVTDAELADVARVTDSAIQAALDGATIKTTKRGKSAGKRRGRLSEVQREGMRQRQVATRARSVAAQSMFATSFRSRLTAARRHTNRKGTA
jgi:hypothetical protein